MNVMRVLGEGSEKLGMVGRLSILLQTVQVSRSNITRSNMSVYPSATDLFVIVCLSVGLLPNEDLKLPSLNNFVKNAINIFPNSPFRST